MPKAPPEPRAIELRPVAQRLLMGKPWRNGTLSQFDLISAQLKVAAYGWGMEKQRNLNFRREENNVVEGGWITKDFCLRLIVSSCKNTKGEARQAGDSSSCQLLTGLLNGALPGLWGGEGSPAKGK